MRADLTCTHSDSYGEKTALRSCPRGSRAARWLARLLSVLLTLCAVAAHAREAQTGLITPWFDVELADGRTLRARELERKVVLQYFWATWCPICHSELPRLQKLYESYRPRGLEIIAQSLDDDESAVLVYWREHGYTFPVAMRSEETRARFGPIRGTPTFILVDRAGTIRLAHLGRMPAEELESRVVALVEEKR